MIHTDDLFLAGLALVRGCALRGVRLRGQNGRRMAVFSLDGPRVVSAEREYFEGPTLVDLQLLKLQIRRLKDAAFGAIREEEEARHAGDEGRHRADQGRERAIGRPR